MHDHHGSAPACAWRDCTAPVAAHSELYCRAHDAIARVPVGNPRRRTVVTTGRVSVGVGTSNAPRGVAPDQSRAFPDPIPLADYFWRTRAACLGTDPSVMVPEVEDAASTAHARALCAGCEVATRCLAEALADTALIGVYGGTSTRERVRIRREARKAA